MTLHIFNPDHDIALASGLANFTAPHAGRQLRHDLGFLPAIWAQEGDTILVDDVEQAQRSWSKAAHRMRVLLGIEHPSSCQFVNKPGKEVTGVEPWGWNIAIRAQLIRLGINELQLPATPTLETIRLLSHRQTAAQLLPKLQTEGTVGEMFECQTQEQVEKLLARYGQLVLKAPWSSSGRGLRFLSVGRTPFEQQAGWFRNVVQSQGCVMVEPHYHKVKDFGMEFYSDGQGRVSYLGLSLFHTANGAYTGNILATENVKREAISHYVSIELLDNIQEKICQETALLFKGKYCGPFGVDMMVTSLHPSPFTSHPSPTALHPCVEVNLRRTMGHVALALSPKDDEVRRVMRIEYSANNYLLTINRL